MMNCGYYVIRSFLIYTDCTLRMRQMQHRQYYYYYHHHHLLYEGIYTYDIPETNYVPREYGVAAILLLLFMVLISLVSVLNLLYFYISTFRSMCAVPNMAIFCSSLFYCYYYHHHHRRHHHYHHPCYHPCAGYLQFYT